MNYFLKENDAINVISSIRVSPFAKMKSKKEKRNGSVNIISTLDINSLHNIWTSATFSITLMSSTTKTLLDSQFEFFLTTTLNNDKLVVANTDTQNSNNSNIFDFLCFFWDNVWIPIAKGNLTVSEEQYKNLIPDIFVLVPDKEILMDTEISDMFDLVINTPTLANLLYSDFFVGTQPIYVPYKDFIDFCKKYNIL